MDRDRIILLALLGIPVLVILHVALFWNPTVSPIIGSSGLDRPRLEGRWQVPETPIRIVTTQATEQGS